MINEMTIPKNELPVDSLKFFSLDSSTTVDDVKKRYRELSKQYHPDCGGTEEQFQELQKHYKQLLDSLGSQIQVQEYSFEVELGQKLYEGFTQKTKKKRNVFSFLSNIFIR